MKKYILLAFALTTLLITTETASARGGLYFGPKVGMNISSFSRTSNATSRIRFQAGAFVGYRMFDILSLQAEALYSMQGTKLDNYKQSLNYLKIPILAKLSLVGNLSAEAGISFNFLVGSNKFDPTGERLRNFDMSVPVGLTYTFLQRIELGLRYDISLIHVDLPFTKDARNSNWAISVGFRF